MGGAIMSMHMQTSDHWNSIHFSLCDYYGKRDGTNASLMTELACIVWNAVVRRRGDKPNLPETVIGTIPFRGKACDLLEDYGHVLGRSFEHEENRILTHFESLLHNWAATGDGQRLNAALDQFANRNRTSLMWTVFMEAGADYPQTLGTLLANVLSESLFLSHFDYSYGGTRLLGALHRIGDPARRRRLERVILDLPKNARLFPDEPRDPMPSWLESAQNRALGVLEGSKIILPATRALRKTRSAKNPLPDNRKPEGCQILSHTFSDEETLERRGVNLNDSANAELFRLREALKTLAISDGNKIDVVALERQWRLIGECELALRRYQRKYQEMSTDLWGRLVSLCENIARHANWPPTSKRWSTVRRILLRAASDPNPRLSPNEAAIEDKWPTWGWPAPRIHSARGLPFLAYRLTRIDNAITRDLRKLSRDKSHPVRFNLADSLAILEKPAAALMWELIDLLVAKEKKFSVLEALVLALNRLSPNASVEAKKRIRTISQRAMQSGPAENHIYETLAHTHLFHFLRTGDSECEAFIISLVDECDSQRAGHALERQLHACRSGGWLTLDGGLNPAPEIDAARTRTWKFLLNLLKVAQVKLQHHREQWNQVHASGQPSDDVLKPIRQGMDCTMRLVDGIAMQLYFASGAFDEKQGKNEERLSPAQLPRFWKEAAPLFAALAAEPHPHTAYQNVQTLRHLLPCAPREVFLLAAKSICNSAAAGFQNESLAIGEVVKLIQRALADHRDIFQNTDANQSECLESLLKVLDLFVEAGWPEARQLTHRLEEIYR
jgi:hypothetical protein